MRRLFVILSIILTVKCFSYDEYHFLPQGKFIYTSHNGGPYNLSGLCFEKGIVYGLEKNKQKVIGTIEKLSEWTRAYIFKVGDTVVSTHRAFLLSSGILFNCLKTYEVYDESNQLIGFIEGVWNTDAAAYFLFYNENHELFAQANLDLSSSKLIISTPDDQVLVTGRKILHVSSDYRPWSASGYFSNQYYWIIKKEKEESFNESFLWPFVGFLSEVWWR